MARERKHILRTMFAIAVVRFDLRAIKASYEQLRPPAISKPPFFQKLDLDTLIDTSRWNVHTMQFHLFVP